MAAWEFSVEQFETNRPKEDLAKELTGASVNGWEFVSVIEVRPGILWTIFRRPRRSEPMTEAVTQKY